MSTTPAASFRSPSAGAPSAASPSALTTAVSVGRLHIVTIAALGTFTFGWLLTGRYLPGLALVSALDWFLVNLLNRAVDVPEDRWNNIPGTDLVARHRRLVVATGFGVLGASLVAVHVVWPTLTPFRLGYHALGLAYNYPLLPARHGGGGGARGPRVRIKQLYFFKNAASALGFVLTVFAYPLAVATVAVPLSTLLFSGLFFFLFELSYEAIYDLRDAPGDKRAGVRTYAVVHGPRTAVRIVDALLLASLLVLVVGYEARVVPWRIAVMGVAPLLQLGLYRVFVRRGITSADCIRLTWLGAGLLGAYHLWVWAGLPLGTPVSSFGGP